MLIIGIGAFVALWATVLLIGFLPLWIYGYLVYSKRATLSDVKGKVWGAVALTLTLLVLSLFSEKLLFLVANVAGLIVLYGGLWGAVVVVGWLPLYCFGCFCYWRRVFPTNRTARVWGIAAALTALLLAMLFCMVAIITGMWG